MPYKVLVPELQVLEAIAELRDINNNHVGYDHKSNQYFLGEEVPDNKVSPAIKDALEAADPDDPTYVHLKDKLAHVGDGNQETLDVAKRLGLPFDDYDSLSEDEVLAAMRVLPSAANSVIKEYEQGHEARERILTFNSGLREAVDDRVKGEKVGASDHVEPDTGKVASGIQTREVSEDAVVLGEGETGSDPAIGASRRNGA